MINIFLRVDFTFWYKFIFCGSRWWWANVYSKSNIVWIWLIRVSIFVVEFTFKGFVVLDPKDPGIGHLIGLMFHRAWTLKEIANKLNKKSEKTFLLQISDLHSKKGYDIMFESGYGGEHWLATFALYNFLR